jgi:hypothetical protein
MPVLINQHAFRPPASGAVREPGLCSAAAPWSTRRPGPGRITSRCPLPRVRPCGAAAGLARHHESGPIIISRVASPCRRPGSLHGPCRRRARSQSQSQHRPRLRRGKELDCTCQDGRTGCGHAVALFCRHVTEPDDRGRLRPEAQKCSWFPLIMVYDELTVIACGTSEFRRFVSHFELFQFLSEIMILALEVLDVSCSAK